MTTIYALMICLTSMTDPHSVANGCSPPENGWLIFHSAEECQRVANHTNQNNPPKRGDAYLIEEKCFKKTVNTWSPVELTD